jgi:hypothetical protein
MPLETITREEFDQRLAQSTEQMRQRRLALEVRAAELEDLIGQYASVLERLEAETDVSNPQKDDLRHVLTELARHTSAVAASL